MTLLNQSMAFGLYFLAAVWIVFFIIKKRASQAALEPLRFNLGSAHRYQGDKRALPQEQQKLTLAMIKPSGEVLHMNPYGSLSLAQTSLFTQVFEGLLVRDTQGEIVGACAESWEYDPNYCLWIFRLKPNLRWSDGTPLYAEDFVRGILARFQVASYESPASPQLLAKKLMQNWGLKGVLEFFKGQGTLEEIGAWAPDKRTLKLQWGSPYHNTLLTMENFIAPNLFPLHADHLALAARGLQGVDLDAYVTNGPFRLQQLQKPDGILLQKNPYFWDAESVALEEVEYRYYEKVDSAVEDWENQEVDLSPPLFTADLKVLHPKNYPYLSEYDTAVISELRFNFKSPKVKDARVRKAINMALNREWLLEQEVLPPKSPLYGYLEPSARGVAFVRPEWVSWTLQQKIAHAQGLMEAAGYHSHHRLSLACMVSPNFDPTRLQAIQALLKILEDSLEIDFRVYEPKAYLDWTLHEKFEVALVQETQSVFTPLTYYHALYFGELGNSLSYESETYNVVFDRLRRSGSYKELEEYVHYLESILWDEVPTIPLFYHSTHYLVNSHVARWNRIHHLPLSPEGIAMARYFYRQ